MPHLRKYFGDFLPKIRLKVANILVTQLSYSNLSCRFGPMSLNASLYKDLKCVVNLIVTYVRYLSVAELLQLKTSAGSKFETSTQQQHNSITTTITTSFRED